MSLFSFLITESLDNGKDIDRYVYKVVNPITDELIAIYPGEKLEDMSRTNPNTWHNREIGGLPSMYNKTLSDLDVNLHLNNEDKKQTIEDIKKEIIVKPELLSNVLDYTANIDINDRKNLINTLKKNFKYLSDKNYFAKEFCKANKLDTKIFTDDINNLYNSMDENTKKKVDMMIQRRINLSSRNLENIIGKDLNDKLMYFINTYANRLITREQLTDIILNKDPTKQVQRHRIISYNQYRNDAELQLLVGPQIEQINKEKKIDDLQPYVTKTLENYVGFEYAKQNGFDSLILQHNLDTNNISWKKLLNTHSKLLNSKGFEVNHANVGRPITTDILHSAVPIPGQNSLKLNKLVQRNKFINRYNEIWNQMSDKEKNLFAQVQTKLRKDSYSYNLRELEARYVLAKNISQFTGNRSQDLQTWEKIWTEYTNSLQQHESLFIKAFNILCENYLLNENKDYLFDENEDEDDKTKDPLPEYTLTIKAYPIGSKVSLQSLSAVQKNNSITVPQGSKVLCTVSKDGYSPYIKTYSIYSDKEEVIKLSEIKDNPTFITQDENWVRGILSKLGVNFSANPYYLSKKEYMGYVYYSSDMHNYTEFEKSIITKNKKIVDGKINYLIVTNHYDELVKILSSSKNNIEATRKWIEFRGKYANETFNMLIDNNKEEWDRKHNKNKNNNIESNFINSFSKLLFEARVKTDPEYILNMAKYFFNKKHKDTDGYQFAINYNLFPEGSTKYINIHNLFNNNNITTKSFNTFDNENVLSTTNLINKVVFGDTIKDNGKWYDIITYYNKIQKEQGSKEARKCLEDFFNNNEIFNANVQTNAEKIIIADELFKHPEMNLDDYSKSYLSNVINSSKLEKRSNYSISNEFKDWMETMYAFEKDIGAENAELWDNVLKISKTKDPQKNTIFWNIFSLILEPNKKPNTFEYNVLLNNFDEFKNIYEKHDKEDVTNEILLLWKKKWSEFLKQYNLNNPVQNIDQYYINKSKMYK